MGRKGLSNTEAKRILLETLSDCVEEKKQRWSWRLFLFRKRFPGDLVRLTLILLASFFLLISFILPFFISGLRIEYRYLAESGIIIMALLLNGIVFVREQRLIKLGMAHRFHEHLYQFANQEDPFQNEYLNSIPQSTFNVIRNDTWITLSTNLLVRGDIILLESEKPVPCQVRVSGSSRVLERGEIFDEHVSSNDSSQCDKIFINIPQLPRKGIQKAKGYTGVLEETPAALQLREAFEFSVKKEQRVQDPLTGKDISMTLPMARWKKSVYKITFTILVVSLVIAIIVNIIKFAVQNGQQQWTELLLVRQAYLCVPLLLITSRWTIHLLHCIGNAIVLTIFHKLQGGETDIITDDQKEGRFYDDEEDERNVRTIEVTRKLPLRTASRYFYHLLFFHNKTISVPPSFSSSVNRPSLLELIGSITTLCVIDKQGILSDNINYIEKLCFFDADKVTILELSRDHNEIPDDSVVHDDAESTLSCQYGLQFNDPDWENYLSSLKPLGLNCLLNSFCKFGEYNSMIERHSIGILHSDQQMEAFASSCHCLLGIRIGFSEGALDSFYPLKHIYRVGDCTNFLQSLSREKSYDSEQENELQQRASKYGYRYFSRRSEGSDNIAGYTISTAVQDKNTGSLQLLSKGSPALILASTTHAWDGTELHEITSDDSVSVLDLEKQWEAYQCVAFSYQPIPEDYYHLLSGSEDINEIGPLGQPNALLPNQSVPVERVSFDSLRKVSDASFRDSLTVSKIPEEDTDEAQEWRKVMEMDHIFIGMIAMRQLPRYEVEDFIIGLKASGTRFVHFSHENRRSTKAFSERLGLETDWNCAIDLRDSDDKVENAPSGLPKGISNIRGHLAEIDDVPLLVPTFYNSSEDSILEMIRIFQEQGEIVCCIGNAVKYANFPIYLQADVSIGWQPQEISCLNHHEESEGQRISSSNFISNHTSGSFSIDLNCLACELIMHKDSTFNSVTALIQTSRHFLINLRQALSFYIGCCVLLHFVFFVNYISFLPTIFNGVQMFWLLLFVIPILSCSIMFSHKSKDTMKNMNTKRNQFIDETIRRGIVSFAAVVVPTSIFIVIFFAIALRLAWASDGSMAGIFGFESSSALRSLKYYDALRVAQNTTLSCFVICLVAWSFPYLQQYHPLHRNFRRYFNIFWLLAATLVIILQGVFMLAMVNVSILIFVMWNSYLLVLVLIFAVIIMMIEFYVKYRFRMWYKKEQQFMALEFNTKLGMYSPVSPF